MIAHLMIFSVLYHCELNIFFFIISGQFKVKTTDGFSKQIIVCCSPSVCGHKGEWKCDENPTGNSE